MKRLVVVGNGMAGMACVEQILKHAPQFDVTVFGDETHVNYNRIMLSSVLAGEKSADDIVINSLEWYQPQRHRSARRRPRSSTSIRCAKTVTGRRRQRHAVRHAAAGDGQHGVDAADRGSRQGRRLHLPHARRHARADRAIAAGREGRRHRRRPARPRGRARAPGAGLRRHRRPPDGDADGAPARSGRRPIT